MNILVCIESVPDTTSKIVFDETQKELKREGVQFIINPYDEWYALVRALEIVETHGGEVTVLNVGLQQNEAIIRKALALGGNQAVRINIEPKTSRQTAQFIAQYVKDKNYDLILGGKETISYNGGVVMGFLAAELGYEYFYHCSKLEVEGENICVQRDVSDGKEIHELPKPLVVSCAKGMAEQRIANMRGIMQARTKPITVVEPNQILPKSAVKEMTLPEKKKKCQMASNAEELVNFLKSSGEIE